MYVSNPGSGQVSSYSLQTDGSISLLNGAATDTSSSSRPIDMALSRDGKNLYVHQPGRKGHCSVRDKSRREPESQGRRCGTTYRCPRHSCELKRQDQLQIEARFGGPFLSIVSDRDTAGRLLIGSRNDLPGH